MICRTLVSKARYGATSASLLALLALLALTTGGCNKGKREIESSGNLKMLVQALLAYHDANNAWPDQLDQVKSMFGKSTAYGVIGGQSDFATVLNNPLTGDNPGYEYVKPKDDAATGAIVLYQLRGGKRDTSVAVAYSDGSVRKPDSPAP